MNPLPEQPPRAAVTHFAPVTAGLMWKPAPAGFSGAVVWRGDDSSGVSRVALKGWPVGTAPERARQIHEWQSRAAHLPFVPTVFTGANGRTAIFAAGRLWDACRWAPGAPQAAPLPAEVGAACEAVARLHLAWHAGPPARPCAAVATRLRMLIDNQALYAGGTLRPAHPALDRLFNRTAQEVARLAPGAIRALQPWAGRAIGTRPCLRDLRGDHVLFESGHVSGIIDYGAMAIDTPAGDLARLLGDFGATDPDLFDTGLRAYRAAGGPLDAPDEFARLLAASGTVCSALGWLVRIFVQREPVAAFGAVAERLRGLLIRTEQIVHF